jgi:hypothetical protein
MRTHQIRKALTFGDLLESAYRATGKRRERGIIQVADKTRFMMLQRSRPLFDFMRGM